MHRLATAVIAWLILGCSTMAMGAPSWPREYRFFGRWDLRAPKRAITVNSGTYIRVRFSGPDLTASFDISLNQRKCECTKDGSFPTIAWRIDEEDWQEAEIGATVHLASGLAQGKHTVMLMVRGLDEHQSRWTTPLVASVNFTGFGLASGGTLEAPLKEWLKPALTMEFLGDSITEGVVVQEGRAGVVKGIPFTWPWLADARSSYAAQTAMALGAEWRQVGFGATGLKLAGSGGVPGALDSFNWFHAACPRDSWQPDVVVVNQGTNDGGMPGSEYQPLYSRYLGLIRAAYPKAKIVALRPFNGAQEASIRAAVDERMAANDLKVYFIDTSGWYSGPLHPNVEGSAALAEKLARAIRTAVLDKRDHP